MKKLYFNIVQTSVFGLLMLCVGALAFGQISTFPHSEGFEAAGLPPGWTNEHVTGTKDWDRVTTNGDNSISPRTGAGMAEFRITNSSSATKLVTPQLDLTSLTVPQLTFYFANVSWGSDIDELRIYYKAAAGDPWTQIGATYDTEHTSWEKVEIILPSPSADYYIAFEGKSNYARGVNIDDVEIGEGPTCPEVTSLTLDDITSANANVSWVSQGPETAWNVSWGTPGFTPGDANEIGTINTTSNPYQITGLTENTSYDVYVQADCGGEESLWGSPISIMTPQTAVSLPYTDDFSSNNWVLGNGTQTNQWHVGGAEGNPANSLYITNDGGTTNAYSHTASVVHASKVFTLPAGSNPFDFSFEWKAGGESSFDYMRVWLIPATAIPTPGTLISTGNTPGAVRLSPEHLNLETTWQVENYEIASSHAGTDVKIVFEWRNDGGVGTTTGAAVDNISFTEITCPTPIDFIVDNFDASTADISWTARGSEAAWNVSWGAPGFTPGDADEIGTINTTSNPYQITGLTENTSYDIYVQADCGGEESLWVGPISITTPQTAISLPYTDDFSSNNWVLGNGTQTNQWHVGGAEGNPANSLYITNDGGTTNEYSHTASVVHASKVFTLPAGSNPFNFSFQWKAGGESSSDYMRVWLIPATATPIPGTSITTTNITGAERLSPQYLNLETIWQTENYEIPSSHAGTDVKIVFEWRNDGFSGTTTGAAVDNISFTEITCPTPIDFIVDNFDASTADISWTARGSETAWNVSWGTPGFTHGDADEIGTINTTSNPYQITGLTENTSYDIYIQADCGGEESLWVGPISVTTLCLPYTVPYFEGFETGYAHDTEVEGCLSQESESGTQTWTANNTFTDRNRTPRTGDWNAFLRYGNTDWLFIPIHLDAGISYTFDMYARQDATSGASVSVSYGSSADVASMTEVIVAETAMIDGDYQLVSGTFTPSTSGVYYVGINGTLDFSPWYISIDDISIYETPDCLAPSDFIASDITESSVELNWTENNSATAWNIEYGVQGFTQGNGTVVSVSTNPYILTGLTDNTSYDIYVQSDCGGDESFWTGPVSITTTQIAVSLPYADDFSSNNWAVGNGTQTNRWHVGGAEGNPANSLYITNDGGTTNEYSHTASIVHASKLFTLPVGSNPFNFSFQWKAGGESIHDYMRVWMIPATENPTPGTLITTADITGAVMLSPQYLNLETIWQTENYEIASSYAGTDVKIVFEWRNDGSSGTTTGAAVDNISFTEITCPAPTSLLVDDFSASTADISWTAGDSETAWNVSWGAPGFTPGDGNQVGTDNVTSASYQITGLTENTSYDIFVQADCGAGEESFWVGPISITTTQIAISLPYVDDFSSNNWVVGNGTQTNQWHVGGAEGNPANSLYITNDGGTTNEYSHTTSVVHASKLFTLPAGSNPFNFSFQWKAGGESSSDYMRVWVIPATENPTPGTLITTADITGAVMLSPQYLNLETIWQTENYEIASSYAGTDVKIVFEWRNDGWGGTTTGAAVDNISFTEITCPAPTDLLTDDLTLSSVDISWTAGGSETTWNVSWGTPGFIPGDANEVGNANVTSPSHQITGLTIDTHYDIYVQADCDADGASIWTGPLNVFIGYCIPTGSNNNADEIRNFKLSNLDNASAASEGTNGYSDYTATVAPAELQRGIPYVAQLTSGTGSGNHGAAIWIDYNDNGVFEESERVASIPSTIAASSTVDFPAFTVPLSIPLGQYRLRVQYRHNIGGADLDPCIASLYAETEDYLIDVLTEPVCVPPIDFVLTGLTNETADIEWTAGDSETAWNVSWGTPGYTPGDGDEVGNASVTSPSYQITGLTENTYYDIYVQADCGSGDESMWVGPLTIYTGYCVPTSTGNTTRYIDGVVTQGALMNINNTGTGLSPDAYGDYTGTDTLRVYPGQEISVEFTHPSSTTYHYKIWVDWDSDLNFDGPNDLIYATTSYQSSPHLVDITIPTLTPEGVYRMRVRNSSTTLGGPCGNNASSETEDYILHVVAPPSCLPVTDIVTTNVSSETATISWIAGGSETTWNVSWGIPGYTPGDGNEVGSATGVTTNPYQITGLTPDTDYEVYVQADCGSGDESIWSIAYAIFTGYCEVSTTYTGDYLSSVTSEDALTNISYSASSQPAGSYANETAQLFSSHPGQTFDIKTTYVGGGNGVNIWIDWDQNMDFDVVTELVASEASSAASKTFEIEVPAGTAPGTYRVRVRAQFGSTANPDPCGNVSYGSTVDFNLVVVDCNAAPGVNGFAEICRADETIDLNDVVTLPSNEGAWEFTSNPSVLNGSILNVGSLPAGSYDILYVVNFPGCLEDTTVATIDVFDPSSAGTGGVITVCKGAAIDLYSALSGNVDMGGDWYDYNGNLLGTSQPTAPSLGASYNYMYITSNGVCDADTAFVEVIVDASPNCTSNIQEEMTVNLSVYPNPTTDVINIVNPTNISALKVEVMDMNGRIVLVEENALNNSTEASISLGKLTIGVYTLRVYNEEGQKVFKVVKR